MIKFLDLDFVKISKPKLKILLRKVASEKHYIINRVEYNFISANKMKEINKEFLDHDDITDIITFDYTDGNKVSAEVFISKEALLKMLPKTVKALKMRQLDFFHTVSYIALDIKIKLKAKKKL